MKHTFFLSASGVGTGLTSASLGVFRALDRRGIRVGFCKPISQEPGRADRPDPSVEFIARSTGHQPPVPIPFEEAERYVGENRLDELMEMVVEKVRSCAEGIDVMIVEGLIATEEKPYINRINRAAVKALSAEVILVNSFNRDDPPDVLQENLKLASSLYGGLGRPNVIGCILNKVRNHRAPAETDTYIRFGIDPTAEAAATGDPAYYNDYKSCVACDNPVFARDDFQLLGCIPWNPLLPSIRVSDVARHLGATIINEGEITRRRVRAVYLCARNVEHILHRMHAGALLIAPHDRVDVILGGAMAATSNIGLAGLIITGGTLTDKNLLQILRPAFQAGLPVLSVPTDSFTTASRLSRISNEIPADDYERFSITLDFIARNIDVDKLQSRIDTELEFRMSPAAFRHQLANRARAANKRIVLPEGNEPRTITAAAICQQRGLARCVLLGDPEEIHLIAERQHVKLDNVEIINPADVRDRYLEPLLERRRHKGLTEAQAREALEDTVVLGTMMLALDEVDGLVSGAVHSSANTIRPALQLIKTRPGARAVSSVFFMCLPEQVLVYGDCAVIPDPDAETLADIAVQSAASAEQFGIPPRVALISYSTGQSGSGADVDKVRAATEIAKKRRPDLLIDGPLQYDAAAIPEVARTKAPDSPVAGRATVFVFPDLNTGNTTYKAVQRSANVISIGPMLQGLRKPVNDLSRGALVEDIVYTIAITAVQADQQA
ncbi:MAG: phosphate acetyltransferase [Verrucomicrobia bacterium]|nr:MAG: phosphate acetyltransferase [Verrucomicrobiota bacterium]